MAPFASIEIFQHGPEVFALLACIDHLLSCHRLLELRGSAADFAVDVGVILHLHARESLADQVSSQVMYDASNFADFGHGGSRWEVDAGHV